MKSYKMQCFVLQNLPFLFQPHSCHNHKSSMTKPNYLIFLTAFVHCSWELFSIFSQESIQNLNSLSLPSCLLCTVLFICQVAVLPSSSLAFVEHFPSSPWEYILWSLTPVKWCGIRWSGQKSYQHWSQCSCLQYVANTNISMIAVERKNLKEDIFFLILYLNKISIIAWVEH